MPKEISTALSLESGSIDWTRLERIRGEWRIVASRRIELPEPPADSASRDGSVDAPPEAGEQAVQVGLDPFPEPVTLCLESTQALFQFLSLPTIEESEVPDMVALQMDKVLPLPAEEMSFAVEVLSTDDVNTTVLACAMPTGVIQESAERLKLAPERIRRVDVAALAWVRLLTAAGAMLDAGRELFLLGEGMSGTLLVVEDGLPVLVRSVGSVGSGDGAQEELLRLLRLSMVQLEVERGVRTLERATLAGPEFQDARFRDRMQSSLGCDLCSLDPETVGSLALGAALRSASGAGFDLTPAQWRNTVSDLRFHRRLYRVAGAALLVWGLGIAALFGGPVLLERRAASLEESLRALEASTRSVRDLRHRVRMIQTYMDRTLSPLEVLREVSLLLPEGVELASFRYRREEGRLSVQGSAQSTPLVYEFKQKVDVSDLFGESTLISGPTTNPRTRFVDFELLILFREESP